MTRILYIGDPTSVHDIKWVSYFSTRKDFEAYFLVQAHEMHLITPERQKQFDKLQITVEGPIKSYSLWRIWDNRRSLREINDIISKRKIDVVHPLFASPFSLWTRNLPVPSIITCRGSDIHVVLAGLGKGSLIQWIHGKLLLKRFKEAFMNAAAITCTSQGQLDRINRIFGTNLKANIIRTGVNVDEINLRDRESDLPVSFKQKRIVFLPRYVRPIYRTELQVRALTALPAALKQNLAIVLIKGNRTDENYLHTVQSELDNCGIPFRLYESVQQEEMWSLFKLSALAIMTPKTDGTPNSALEAMAAGCPVILGSFDYDVDLFSDNYCLRMSTDRPDELATLISTALTAYPEGMLDAARANVRLKGNRPVEMERLLQLYSDLTTTTEKL